MSETRNEGFDDFLDALENGDPYYLEGPNGDGWLPPRQVDPATGSQDLTQKSLPTTGQILTFTKTHVAAPEFVDDAPFIVAIVDVGPVKITGQLRDADTDDIEIGQEVELGVEKSTTEDRRLITFSLV